MEAPSFQSYRDNKPLQPSSSSYPYTQPQVYQNLPPFPIPIDTLGHPDERNRPEYNTSRTIDLQNDGKLEPMNPQHFPMETRNNELTSHSPASAGRPAVYSHPISPHWQSHPLQSGGRQSHPPTTHHRFMEGNGSSAPTETKQKMSSDASMAGAGFSPFGASTNGKMDADAQTTIRNDSSSRCRTSRSTSLSSVDFHLSSPPRRPLSPNHLTTSPVAALHQTWIISTRRPSNPLDAFGITISPLANPPPHILAGASRLPSPPHRPKSPASTERPPPLPTSKSVGVNPAVARQAEDLVEATTCSTPRTDVPSPTSSTPQVKSTLVDPSLAHNDTNGVASTVASSHTSDNATVESSGSPNLPEEHPPVVKKSWASLLRSGSTSGLPTSSVVGVSIPAESKPNSAPTQRVAADQRSDLLALLTSGPRRNDGISHIRPRGLVNTGNICFANAVLQVLVYCSPFYRLFSDLEKYLTSQTGADPSTPRSIPLVEAYVEFLKEFKPKGRSKSRDNSDEDDGLDSFIPTYMYDAMKEKPRFDSMRGGHQEDAEEFLGFLLDALEEELLDLQATLGSNSKTAKIADEATTHQDGWVEVGKRNKFVVTRNNKSVESPITKIFGGKFRSTLKVVGQRDSVLVEDWRALQLDIQPEQVHNVEDALRHISFPQSVQVSSVTKGGAIVDATQHVLVESLPAILVLHLKRFLYDTSAKGVVKIGKHVAFRPELEFPSEIMSPLRRPAHPIKFKLFGVLYHHGQSASGGHYTLDVLHPNRNADLSMKPHEGWIRIDDELVSDLRTNDVFGDGLDDRCAYLLFYKQLPNRT